MAKGPTAAVAAAARAHAVPHDDRDKLLEITKTGELAREMEQKIATLEEDLKAERAKLNALYYDRLPTLLSEARMDNFTLAASGNSPATEYKMTAIYRASISSEWPEEKQARAFAVLKRLKAEALIKSKVEIVMSKGQQALVAKIQKALKPLGINPSVKESVHHGTLGAWLKEQYVVKKKPLPSADLEAIGAFVGRVVKPKEKESE